MEFAVLVRDKQVQKTVLAVAASFVGGSLAGYFFGKKHGKQEVFNYYTTTVVKDEPLLRERGVDISTLLDEEWPQERIDEDVERVIRNHLQELEQQTEPPAYDLEAEEAHGERVEVFLEKLKEKRLVEGEPEEPRPPVRVNVFAGSDSDWDYESELSTRSPNAPYVIHADEFIGDEMGYKQTTVTYYAGDDIMADVDDTPIYGHRQMMGDLKFGHGSKDPNVVYIRSEPLRMEWEVLRHAGKFGEEVLGLQAEEEMEDEIRHSHPVRKFRITD